MPNADRTFIRDGVNRLLHTVLETGGSKQEFAAILAEIAAEYQEPPLGAEEIAPVGSHQEECPHCDGSGEDVRYWPATAGAPRHRTCSVCEGSGTVEVPGPLDDPHNPEGDPIVETDSLDEAAAKLGQRDQFPDDDMA